MTVCFTLAVSVVGGYAFARFTFPGRDGLFLLTLAILMVPYGTLLIPMYVLLHAIGLQNSLLGVCLVLTLFQLPFAIFMMRISFESVPKELEESALVDGAGTLALLRRIFLPSVRPGLITVGALRVPRRVERLHHPADPPRRRQAVAAPVGDRQSCASRRRSRSTTARPRRASS